MYILGLNVRLTMNMIQQQPYFTLTTSYQLRTNITSYWERNIGPFSQFFVLIVLN